MTARLDCIICGDCITELAKLDARSVDLAFADPPFNIGYDYDVYDDRRAADDYLDWSRKWIEGVLRVLKPDGTFWLAIGDEYAAELKVLCTRELGLHLRNWVVWFYTFGVHCKQKFTRSHAHLLYFVKRHEAEELRSHEATKPRRAKIKPTRASGTNFGRVTFNDSAIRVPSARQVVYGDKRADPDGRVPDDTWMMTPVLPPEVPTRDGFILRPQDIPDRFPPHNDTWYFPRVCGTFKERRGFHGCQMPEQLLGRIVKACSNEGDVVLDPFAGSGTTLAVAKKLGRKYLGFEISKDYSTQTTKRLSKIKPGDPLNGAEDPLTSVPDTTNGTVRTSNGERVRKSAGDGSRSMKHAQSMLWG